MAMDWADYEPYQPQTDGPPDELPRSAAKRRYDQLMAARFERIEALRRLLAANGITLDTTDEGIQRLNDWFRENVTGDRETGRLDSMWYVVVRDISLFLGEVMIARWPTLHWEFFTHGKRDICYQRHVIAGYSKPKNPHFYTDTDQPNAGYGSQIVTGQDVKPTQWVEGLRWLEQWV
jgi:hypothetical protein